MSNLVDINNLAVSLEASQAADDIMETGLFRDKVDVLTFAAGYMIKNHVDDFDPSAYRPADSDGSNFAAGTYDPNHEWEILIRALYNDTETPYLYLRALMDQGLLELKQKMNSDPAYSITQELK